jgi:hypothetical protein
MEMNDVNSWGKFTTWQSVTPPSRPDGWQIQACREALSKRPKDSFIAVLGSTIEYRRLLVELGFKNIIIFERNIEFYKYITPFLGSEPHETLVHGNWLDTLFGFEEKFDVILSDLTSGNISYKDRIKFYNGITMALSAKGIFIDRILTKPVPFINLDDLIKKYSKMNINKKNINSFNCEIMFCSTLLENKKSIVETSIFYDTLCLLNIPRITEFVNACYSITPRDCVWWYSKDWSEESKTYERFFSIKDIYDEPKTSEYYSRAKLFVSNKKGDRV